MIYRILSVHLILAVLVATFMMPATVMADGASAGESTRAMSTENFIQGTLVVMEKYGHILIRPEVGNLARLRVRGDAIITRNGEPAKLGDLRLGDEVRANYNSKNLVSELHATGT